MSFCHFSHRTLYDERILGMPSYWENDSSRRNTMMKIGCKLVFLVLGSLYVAVWLSQETLAQATIGSALLRGTVQDSSQAAVPRVTVIATNEATNVSDKVSTDEQGQYVFQKLQPGSYTIRVEASGFKAAVRSGVVLRVGQQSDLDFTLDVGEVTTTVEITAAAPLLNSVSAALGAEVDNRYITEVPLFDRQITNLAFLAPGVTQTANDSFGGNNQAGYAGTNFSSNGQKSATAEVRWDGLSSSPPDGTGSGNQFFYAQIQPSPEFVQEFKVETNSFSAEYRTNGGTVLNIVSKSGSNNFHGSGYYWGRRPRGTPTTSLRIAKARTNPSTNETTTAARSEAPSSRTRASSSLTTIEWTFKPLAPRQPLSRPQQSAGGISRSPLTQTVPFARSTIRFSPIR